jgi:hypothetical protein
MTKTNIEYYFSKTSIIITSFLLFIIVTAFVFTTYILYLADLKIGIIICIFIFFLFLATFSDFSNRLKLFKEKIPALILTEDELIDNINFQKFRWIDIKTISSSSVYIKSANVKYIAISLIDSDKYINNISSPYKRLIARLNQKYFRGAFSIQPNIIKCKSAELLTALLEFQKKVNE